MVGAHVTDAWVREADRHDSRFFGTVFVNGLAAPLFMLLAGLALTMAAERRSRQGAPAEAARAAMRRGWQVFGLAFLFRVQSQLLGWGPLVNLLKVDILNIMGLSMALAAALWRVGRSPAIRSVLFLASALAIVFATPLVRETPLLAPLPDPLEWYLRPTPGRATFSAFSWTAFLLLGAMLGEWIDAARTPARERTLHTALAGLAVASVTGGYAASFLPALYPAVNFWTTSPTFLFIRLGIVLALIPMAWLVRLQWAPLMTLGRSSLFVYWIHVEMVYGALGYPLKRLLPWEAAIAATLALCVLLHWLVQQKDRWLATHALPPALRVFGPVLR